MKFNITVRNNGTLHNTGEDFLYIITNIVGQEVARGTGETQERARWRAERHADNIFDHIFPDWNNGFGDFSYSYKTNNASHVSYEDWLAADKIEEV